MSGIQQRVHRVFVVSVVGVAPGGAGVASGHVGG